MTRQAGKPAPRSLIFDQRRFLARQPAKHELELAYRLRPFRQHAGERIPQCVVPASADAAGLPILPGLVRFDEVASGRIEHAIRFTAQNTRKAHVWPARHDASSLTGAQYPPMGMRFRLKASFDESSYSPAARTILVALKRYGIILADNGSNWFITGASDSRWNDDMLSELKRVKGADFEAVDASSLMVSYDSAQVRYPAAVIKQCSVHGGTIQFTVTNLFPGVSNVIKRTSSLSSPDWQIVDRFLSESTSTNWAAPLPGNLSQAYYRVRRL